MKKKLDDSLKRDIDSVLNGARNTLSKPAERYMRCVVDPRSNTSARTVAPTGFSGRSGIVSCKARVTVITGTQSYGYLGVSPVLAGPVSDRPPVIATTSSTSILSSGSAIPVAAVGSQIETVTWNNVPQAAASIVSFSQYAWRPVAFAVYVTPSSAVTAQGGTMYLHESPSHAAVDGLSLSTIANAKCTRQVSGTQLAGDGSIICLNYHPCHGLSGETASNDLEFNSTGSATAGVTGQTLSIVFEAATGTSFQCEVFGVYEVTGSNVQNARHRVQDSRGWDILVNSFTEHSLSGWVGRPHHAQASYLSVAWKHAKALASSAYRKVLRPELKSLASEFGFL